MRTPRSTFRAILFFFLTAILHACSCGSPDPDRLTPKLEFLGEAIDKDPLARADLAINFGMVTVGSQVTPDIIAVNSGTARLNAKVVDPETIPEIFSLGFGALDLRPKEQRKVTFSVLPTKSGPFEATITLDTNEEKAIKTIRLYGEAIQSELVCTPGLIDIGDVVRGETRSGVATCTNHLNVPTTVVLGEFIGAYRQHFTSELQATDPVTTEIPAGGSIDILITFESGMNLRGIASVNLPVEDVSGRPMLTLRVDANVVEHSLQVRYESGGEKIPLAGCFRFPDTDIETETQQTLYVRNLSRNPVNLESLSLLHQDDDVFRIITKLDGSVLVPPNGEEDVEITIAFTPPNASSFENRLIVRSDDPLEPAGVDGGVRACIEGQGAGARISCIPSDIQFGPVALNMSVTRRYTCHNSAQPEEGATQQVLFVKKVVSSDPNLFTAKLLNPDGTEEPKNHGYLPGEEFTIEVTYSPLVHGFDSAFITVENNSSTDPEHKTQVTGQGRDVPPCSFEISPASLRFGVVEPGDQRTLAAYVVNHFDTECYVSDVRLSMDSSDAYTLEEIPTHTLKGHERLPISVTFAPREFGDSFTGQVEFYISNPADPQQVIPLSGIAKTPCLEFDPREADFGSAPPNCAGRDLIVSMVNTCATPLTITDISISDAYPQFDFSDLPILPVELKGGEREEFTVYFQPDALDRFEGGVHVEVQNADTGEDAGPYVFEMVGRGQEITRQTDTYTQKDQPKVDLLWVIDNSGSMGPMQDLIHDNVPNFMQFAIDQGIDFHIGVTTSGVAYDPINSPNCYGGFNGDEDGRLTPHPSEGRARILKSNMPRDLLLDTFRQNIQVGTCHIWEAMYEAPRRALSDPWINTPESEGGNKGFLRNDAALSIIGVTQEPDNDSFWDGDRTADRSVERYVEWFQSLKPSRKKDTVKIHFISGGMVDECTGVQACPRCVHGTELTGGVWLNFCTPDSDPRWEDAFREMSQGAFGFDSFFELRGLPKDENGDDIIDDEDVTVEVDGRVVRSYSRDGVRIWSYNANSNSISFAPQFVPGADQLISVTYTVACAK